MQRLKKIFLYFLFSVISVCAIIYFTGNKCLFTGINHTYLKGNSHPEITDIDVFENREIKVSNNPILWDKKETNYALTFDEVTFVNSIETASFLVIKKDTIVYENYWNEFSQNMPTNSFSMAKSVVSILIGIALEDGLISSLDTSIGAYLIPYKNSDITIRHLLWMSSGLDWTESGGNPFSDNAKAYYGDDLKTLVLNQKEIERPGKVYNYKSGNTQLLALILENATGKNISEYAEEKLWKKIGAEHPAFWSLDEKGLEKAFCCLYAIPRDFAKIGKLILDNGMVNDSQIISKNYLTESLQPNPTIDTDGDKNKRYGMHFWMGHYNSERFYHLQGLYGQYIVVLPESELIIVRTGKEREPNNKTKLPNDLYKFIKIAKKM